jgi:hypothetical protein
LEACHAYLDYHDQFECEWSCDAGYGGHAFRDDVFAVRHLIEGLNGLLTGELAMWPAHALHSAAECRRYGDENMTQFYDRWARKG